MARDVNMDEAVSSPLEDLITGRPASDRQRRIIWLFAVIALIALAILVLRFLTGHETPYRTQAITRETLEPRLAVRGRVYPMRVVEVGAPFAGTVTALYAADDARVVRGQPLARIEPRERSSVQEMEAALVAARAEGEEAAALRDEAASRLARIEDVFQRSEGRVPARRELEEAEAALRGRHAALDAANARIAAAVARLSEAERHLSRSLIRSPVDGYVVATKIRVGQPISDADQPILTLAPDLGEIAVRTMVPQAVIGDIKRGSRATLTVNFLPDRSFAAQVQEVAPNPKGNPAAFRVTLIAQNPQGLLRRGMEGTVELALPPRNDALLVPNAAFHFEPATKRAPSERNDGLETIYLLNKDGRIDPVAVSAGASDGLWTEIRSGAVKAGDQVVVGWRETPPDARASSRE